MEPPFRARPIATISQLIPWCFPTRSGTCWRCFTDTQPKHANVGLLPGLYNCVRLGRLRELHLVVTGCEPGNGLPSVRLYPPQDLHRKSNIADEGVPTNALTLKQKGKGIICDPTAGTRQAQAGIILHCLCHRASPPVLIDLHPTIIAQGWSGASSWRKGDKRERVRRLFAPNPKVTEGKNASPYRKKAGRDRVAGKCSTSWLCPPRTKSPGSGGCSTEHCQTKSHNHPRPNQPNMVIRMQRRSACSSTCESPS
jgi:hypothetical protein